MLDTCHPEIHMWNDEPSAMIVGIRAFGRQLWLQIGHQDGEIMVGLVHLGGKRETKGFLL